MGHGIKRLEATMFALIEVAGTSDCSHPCRPLRIKKYLSVDMSGDWDASSGTWTMDPGGQALQGPYPPSVIEY